MAPSDDVDEIRLEVEGDVKPEAAEEPPSIVRPRSLTLPAPRGRDRVAVLRAPPEVVQIAVLSRKEGLYDGDFDERAPGDEAQQSEFWIDADSIEAADAIYVGTRGDVLESVQVEVEYRGWLGWLKRRVRAFEQRRRARKELSLRA